eukprot:8424619-Lingulodinium_polyedra.AAC.1
MECARRAIRKPLWRRPSNTQAAPKQHPKQFPSNAQAITKQRQHLTQATSTQHPNNTQATRG